MTTLEDLQRKLDSLGVPRSMYALGYERNEAYCVVLDDGKWHVFYAERGNRNSEVVFADEAAACNALLLAVLEDSNWLPPPGSSAPGRTRPGVRASKSSDSKFGGPGARADQPSLVVSLEWFAPELGGRVSGPPTGPEYFATAVAGSARDHTKASAEGEHHSVRITWENDRGSALLTFLFPDAMTDSDLDAGSWLIMEGPHPVAHARAASPEAQP